MIKLISDRPTCDLPCCQSVIFFPAGRTPAGKKMTLRQCGRSRARLSSVAETDLITYKLSISSTSMCLCLPLSFTYYVDAEDTSEHTGARSCLLHPYLSLFDTARTQRT